jgi:hypothetical protein
MHHPYETIGLNVVEFRHNSLCSWNPCPSGILANLTSPDSRNEALKTH